jgi:hypothetical protein
MAKRRLHPCFEEVSQLHTSLWAEIQRLTGWKIDQVYAGRHLMPFEPVEVEAARFDRQFSPEETCRPNG